MKKHLLLPVLVLVATALQAQYREMYSIVFHDKTEYFYEIFNSMQQRDCDHIIDVHLSEDDGSDDGIPFGRMCYKISSVTHAITDSMFVADTTWNWHHTFLARHPRGEGNIRVAFEYQEDCDSTFVHISHFFDDNLHTNPDEDIVIPVCEGIAWESRHGFLIDSVDDLVMTYYKMRGEMVSDQYIVRIGLDGTLKQHALLAENIRHTIGSIGKLRESPLQYYQWSGLYTYPYTDLDVYVIDSLFNIDTVRLNGVLKTELVYVHPSDSLYNDTTFNWYEKEYLQILYDTQVIPVGGNDVLVAAQYILDTTYHVTRDYGVAVARYDLSTKELKGYVVFNDNHSYYSTGRPLGLRMMGDGTVYFVYKEYCYPDESIVAVKMDANFNVEWKRFYKTGNINMFPPFESSIVFENDNGGEKGVSWCGYGVKDGNYGNTGWVYFFHNHDGTVSGTEGDIEVRPYTYYPNPAQDQLHLQYSPDVKPAQIELYDMQGRLVKMQRNGLESLNLQGLSACTYTMRITMENGKVFSDKVVKE